MGWDSPHFSKNGFEGPVKDRRCNLTDLQCDVVHQTSLCLLLWMKQNFVKSGCHDKEITKERGKDSIKGRR